MRNIKLTIEYDGTNYCGWQIQPNGVTVQEVLQKALAKMTKEKIKLTGASRTDSGVHAFGQVANFQTSSKVPCSGFLKGLNSILPDDISIKKAEEVPETFHSKKCARGKHYRYLIYCGEAKSALLRNSVWHVKRELNVKKMNGVAQTFVGVHDFSSFCALDDANRSKVREIKKIDVKCRKSEVGELIVINIFGTGFLKYMVRNIVGTLVKVGSKSELKKILICKDRKEAGVTAPARGLSLVSVLY